MTFEQFFNQYFYIIAIWELTLKGFALWRASKRNELIWYIVILVVNSIGILPITYLLYDKFFREKFKVLFAKFSKKS